MNTDELRSRRREIIEKAANISGPTHLRYRWIDECLRDLESLDSATHTQHNAYYDFLNRFDTLYRLFKAAEGNPGSLLATSDLMIAAIMAYRETLNTQETQES